MTLARALMLLLVASALTVSACGKKGDPIHPGDEPEKHEAN